MQSVVTGQAPITLERKITSQEENKQKQRIIHTITKTNLTPQIKKKKKKGKKKKKKKKKRKKKKKKKKKKKRRGDC